MSGWDVLPYSLGIIAVVATRSTRVAILRSIKIRSARRWAWRGAAVVAGLMALVTVVLCVATFWYTHRIRPKPTSIRLFEGIQYIREVRQLPRPIVVHVVKIDLKAEGIKFLVTPPDPTSGRMLKARKTTDFLDEFGVQIAINANYFYPFVANGPWDYYPKTGDPVDVCGIAASNGTLYSPSRWKDGTVYLSQQNEIRFDDPTRGIDQALSGNGVLLRHGKTLGPFEETDFNSRAALAVDQEARHLILVIIDGKQPNFSEGVTLDELAAIIHEHGGHDAIRLDEGGSATLAAQGPDGRAILLNSPINSRIPGFERPVANHLGIFARP